MPKILDSVGREKIGMNGRVFTLAEWPPVGAIPGERVILSDTYNGFPFGGTFEYKPEVNPSFPWEAVNPVTTIYKKPLNASTYDNSVSQALGGVRSTIFAGHVIGLGGTNPLVRPRVPRAGIYRISWRVPISQSGGYAVDGGLIVHNNLVDWSGSANVAMPSSPVSLSVVTLGNTFGGQRGQDNIDMTLAAGDRPDVALWTTGGSGLFTFTPNMEIYPVRIA